MWKKSYFGPSAVSGSCALVVGAGGSVETGLAVIAGVGGGELALTAGAGGCAVGIANGATDAITAGGASLGFGSTITYG
jgi:hypothetical protein